MPQIGKSEWFQTFPSIFFELINHPPEEADAYQFSSVEIKQLAFRIDGVFLPTPDALDQPIYRSFITLVREKLKVKSPKLDRVRHLDFNFSHKARNVDYYVNPFAAYFQDVMEDAKREAKIEAVPRFLSIGVECGASSRGVRFGHRDCEAGTGIRSSE